MPFIGSFEAYLSILRLSVASVGGSSHLGLLLLLELLLLHGLLVSAALGSIHERLNLVCVTNEHAVILSEEAVEDELRNLDLDKRSVDVERLTTSEVRLHVVLRNVVSLDDLLDLAVEDLKLLRAADTATEREDTTLARVGASRRVSNAERAVMTIAVADLDLVVWWSQPLVVASLAEVVSTEAVEESSGAAEHALPVDLGSAVLLTSGLTGTDLLEEAFLADQVLLLGLLSHLHLITAVDETTEVGLLAGVALVDRAAEVGVGLWAAVEVAILLSDTGILKDALLLSVDQSHLLDLLSEAQERTKLSSNRARETLDLNLLLACRASHKSEGDAERAPLVLQELNDAASVENVTAAQSGASLSTELSGVADAAQLVSVDTALVVLVSTVFVEAGEAVALTLDTVACVAACVNLVASGNDALIFYISVNASVDHNCLNRLFNLLNVQLNLGNLDRNASGKGWLCLGDDHVVSAVGELERGSACHSHIDHHNLSVFVENLVFFVFDYTTVPAKLRI